MHRVTISTLMFSQSKKEKKKEEEEEDYVLCQETASQMNLRSKPHLPFLFLCLISVKEEKREGEEDEEGKN